MTIADPKPALHTCFRVRVSLPLSLKDLAWLQCPAHTADMPTSCQWPVLSTVFYCRFLSREQGLRQSFTCDRPDDVAKQFTNRQDHIRSPVSNDADAYQSCAHIENSRNSDAIL